MNLSNFGAVRRALYASAVLTLFAVPSGAQMVEKERTFADLTSSHPCSSGYTGRNAIVTDCDAADDIGDGGGAFRCFAHCDGSAPWEAVSIGGGAGGAGVSGLDTADGGTALADNALVRGDGTTGIQGSAVTVGDVGSNLIPFTASTGNRFSFTGSTHYPFQVVGSSGAVAIIGDLDASNSGLWLGETSPGDTNYALLADGTNITLNIPSAGGSFYFRRNDSTLLATLDTNALFLRSVPVLSRQKVVASTEGSGAPYAIPSDESGAVNTNEGSTAENYETLPAAVAGLQFTFVVQDTNGMRITAAAGDTIRPIAGTAASATGGFIRCATAGAYIRLIAINATEWVAVGSAGVWTIDI